MHGVVWSWPLTSPRIAALPTTRTNTLYLKTLLGLVVFIIITSREVERVKWTKIEKNVTYIEMFQLRRWLKMLLLPGRQQQLNCPLLRHNLKGTVPPGRSKCSFFSLKVLMKIPKLSYRIWKDHQRIESELGRQLTWPLSWPFHHAGSSRSSTRTTSPCKKLISSSFCAVYGNNATTWSAIPKSSLEFFMKERE